MREGPSSSSVAEGFSAGEDEEGEVPLGLLCVALGRERRFEEAMAVEKTAGGGWWFC